MRLRFLLLLLGLAASLSGHTAWAQVVAPSKGSSVRAVRVTATTIEISFGNTGTGQGRVVAVAESPSGRPMATGVVNGQFYQANTVFGQGTPTGSGYVIYNGTGHSATVTGLKPSTSYYFTNAEYNSDGTTIVYNTSGNGMLTSTRSGPASPTIIAPTPLPVELTSFSGTIDTHDIATLQWTTATERNTAYFALERSNNGVDFAEAGRVAAANASVKPLAYRWLDPQRLVVPTYFRLRQADTDGAVTYSSVVALAPASKHAQRIEVYPNPSAGRAVQLLLQGYEGEALTLRLTDALGRSVLAQSLTPLDAQYLSPLALPQGLVSGTYVLTLAGKVNTVQKRIVVSD
jgi:hypothetical protein